MAKSIETIWKEGFIDDDSVIIPKITDLYNQKSQNLVDKFHRMFDINRKAILAGAVVVVAVSTLIDLPFIGLIIAAMLVFLVYIGNNGYKQLKNLDKGSSSYEYLKAFAEWRTEMLELYGKAYTYFYPLFFMVLAIRFRFSEDARAIINFIAAELPDTLMIAGTPWFLVAGFLAITGLLFYYGRALYKIDVDIVYGPSFRKLDALIAEMEELRK
jgi:hypothetical protein